MDLKMEVYSPFLELLGPLEIQNSIIWENKAFSSGSFTLNSLITEESKTLLVPENIIWIAGDDAGIIEYIQQETGEDGPYITVKGCNLTGVLGRYILWGPHNLTGPVPEIMRRLVDSCCIHPTLGDFPESRIIPNLVLSDEIAASGPSIRTQKTGGNLLDALEELGTAYGVSFGVRFNPAVPRMEFWSRYGVNRSVNQNVAEPVFYSTELDDVLSSEYSYNAQNWRNAALVAGEGEGKDRVMVMVNAQTPETPDVPSPPDPPAPVQYTIALAVDPEGGGTASGGGQLDAGRSVTVRAAASSGYAFAGWQENGETVSTEEAYTFQVRRDRTLTAVFASMAPREFSYTGDVAAVTLSPGLYRLEVWGAEGGYRTSAAYAGKGGYSVGSIRITQPTPVFVRVGGSGNTGGTAGGFNGGGRRGTYNGGGGASDIRIGADDLNHRVIVAGGGGSDGGSSKPGKYGGGQSGGDVGSSGSANGYGTAGYGGTQTGNSGGTGWIAQEQSAATVNDADAKSGFGFGGNGVNKNGGFGGAGGGGWYGGAGRIPDGSGDDDGGGGGGSGFVWTGENAPDGFGLTEEHYLTNAQTIDGAQSFAGPDGAAETGHSGSGYARITPVVPHTITVLTQDAAHGAVSGGGTYESGMQVTVTAAPAYGYRFTAWMEGGIEVSTDAGYTFTVTSDRTLVAAFEEHTSRLPEGYTELEYIQNSNGSNSGYLIIPWSAEVKHFVLEFENLSVPGTSGKNIQTLIGYDMVYKPGTAYINSHSGIFLKTSTIEAITNNSVKSSVAVQNFQKRNIFEFDCINNVLKINKVEHPFDCSYLASSSTTKSFFYERANMSGSNTSTYGRMLGKIFQIKTMDSNGGILYNGVPCSKDDGTFGLYDIVSGTFMSLDALKFIPGPAV